MFAISYPDFMPLEGALMMTITALMIIPKSTSKKKAKLMEEIYSMTDQEVLAAENGGRRVFNHTEYYFAVINPDVVKRWQP